MTRRTFMAAVAAAVAALALAPEDPLQEFAAIASAEFAAFPAIQFDGVKVSELDGYEIRAKVRGYQWFGVALVSSEQARAEIVRFQARNVAELLQEKLDHSLTGYGEPLQPDVA